MAVDALCNLYSASITSAGSSGTVFDLKTQTPLEGLPIKVRLNGGATSTSTTTMIISITASDDNFTTTHETLYSKTITFTTTNYAQDFEEVYVIQTQRRYIRVVVGNPGATLGTAAAVAVDIVTGRQNP